MDLLKFDITFIGEYIARLLSEIEQKEFKFIMPKVHSIVLSDERWGQSTSKEERVLYIVVDSEYAEEEYNEIVDWRRDYSVYDKGACLYISDEIYSFRYNLDYLKEYKCAGKYDYILELPNLIRKYCNNNFIDSLSENELNNLFDYLIEQLLIIKNKFRVDQQEMKRKLNIK